MQQSNSASPLDRSGVWYQTHFDKVVKSAIDYAQIYRRLSYES